MPLNRKVSWISLLEVKSPLLHEFLHKEAELSIHEKLPHEKGMFTAMGLFWLLQQLHYHTAILNCISVERKSQVKSQFWQPTKMCAIWLGCSEFFGYFFQAAPPVKSKLTLRHKDHYDTILQQSKTLVTSSEQMVITAGLSDADSYKPIMSTTIILCLLVQIALYSRRKVVDWEHSSRPL